jgi:hypothetical protein
VHGLIFSSFRRFTDAEVPGVTEVVWPDSRDYREDEAYSDDEFDELVEAVATAANISRRDVLLRFGSFTAQHVFKALRPDFYDESGGTRQFLLDVELRIHRMLTSTIPDAAPPRLQVGPLGSGGVSITYTSHRRLCELLEGLVMGTAAHYGERFDIDQPICVHRGDEACAFFVTPALD